MSKRGNNQGISPVTRADTRRATSGFTLVEIMIVVGVIGILAAIAIPALQKARIAALQNAFINDLRVFTDAAEMFAMEQHGYPGNTEPGELVPKWSEYIDVQIWVNPTVIGGLWDIETGSGVVFALGVTNPDLTTDDLRAIDKKVDDGNLMTGNFRELSTKCYYWVVEE